MNDVKINKTELLVKIIANRLAHETDYNEAMTAYRKKAIEKLTEMLKSAKSGGNILINTGLTQPVNQLSSYDKAIAMLEMSVDKEIELSERDFDCYVLDNWDWKAFTLMANSAYK